MFRFRDHEPRTFRVVYSFTNGEPENKYQIISEFCEKLKVIYSFMPEEELDYNDQYDRMFLNSVTRFVNNLTSLELERGKGLGLMLCFDFWDDEMFYGILPDGNQIRVSEVIIELA